MGNKIEGAEKNWIVEINQQRSPFSNEYLSTSLPSKKLFINDFKYYARYESFVTVSQISRRVAGSSKYKRDKVTAWVIFWKYVNNEFTISNSFKIVHQFTNFSPFSLHSCLKSAYFFLEFQPYSLYGQHIFGFDLFNNPKSKSNIDPNTGSMKPFCDINIGRCRYNIFTFNNKEYLLKYDIRGRNFRSLMINKFPSNELLLDYKGDYINMKSKQFIKTEGWWWWRTKSVQNCNQLNIIYVLAGFGSTLHLDQVNLQNMSVNQICTFNIHSYGFVNWDVSTKYAQRAKSFSIKGMKVSPNGKWIIVVTNEGFFILSVPDNNEVFWKSDSLFSLTWKTKPLYIENISPHKGHRAYIDWYKTNECMIYLNGRYYQFVVTDIKVIIHILEAYGLWTDVINILLQFCAIEKVIYRVHTIPFEEKTGIHYRHLKVGDICSFYINNEIKMVSRRGVMYTESKKDNKQTFALFEMDTYTILTI
eukprot:295381_1